jgi:hypothetical protein
MTNEREVERVLERWLIDGIDAMPDRVYLSILDRVERQPQQRAWRVSWRNSTMNAYLKPILAVAAALAIVIGGIAIVARPSGSSIAGTVSSSSPPSPSPSPVPSPTPTPAWDDSPQCGDQGCGGPQGEGNHTSRSLNPTLAYTLTSNWVNVRDWPDYFMLYPDTLANRAVAAAGGYAPNILVLPGSIAVSPTARCEDDPTSDDVATDAAGFASAVAARKGLSVTEPVPVAMSGLTGLQFDVGLDPGSDTGCVPGAGVLPLGDPVTPDDRYRVIVLDSPDGGAMLIKLWAPTNEFNSFMGEAMPVVRSFEFDFSQPSSPAPS